MQYGELVWNEIPKVTSKVVVLPLGSLEQHGQHLPLLTDSMIGNEIVRQVESNLGDEVLFLPMLWIGSSHHHLNLAGTVSISHEVYVRVIVDIIESLIKAGFRRILLLNSHGGNADPAHIAMEQVQVRHSQELSDLWLAFASWVHIASEQIASISELHQKYVSHACEVETSIILYLRPELVQMGSVRGAKVSFPSKFYCPDDSRTSYVTVARTFEQVTKSGALGYPELGTAEKGKIVLAVVVKEVVSFVREFANWENLAPN